jgi:hypothetical protein
MNAVKWREGSEGIELKEVRCTRASYVSKEVKDKSLCARRWLLLVRMYEGVRQETLLASSEYLILY